MTSSAGANGEVRDARADCVDDSREVSGHSSGEVGGCALEPASRMNEALDPFNRSQVAFESLEIGGIESDGAHRDAYFPVAECLRRALDLPQDLWSAESCVLDRSTHGSLLGLVQRHDSRAYAEL